MRPKTDSAGGLNQKYKVIFESAYLTDEQKILACHLSEAAGATVADVQLMRVGVGPQVQVKAAHGVHTLDALLAMIEAGTTRAGATTTAVMLDEFKQRRGG